MQTKRRAVHVRLILLLLFVILFVLFIYTFLHEAGHAIVGIFIVVRDINTSYFDLSLIGPDGYHSAVLHGEDYRADRDGGLWEEKLLPGTYQSVLTSHQSPGTAAIFLKTP